ncbi:MAG TPA: M28 family peptidase [Candidatus Acidoferrum sp.]|nr:M28 family peptidase [Candidatus Acidoferrum sp.]
MRKLVIFVAAAVLGGGVLLAAKSHRPKIDAQRIRQHVKYLSSDALEGRGTGQKGGDLAADYIAAQFKSYGLKPAGENGTYFQSVPLVGVKTLPETSFALAPASGEPLVLRNLDDYVTSNETQTEIVNIDAPIVFVGYGITAPEEKWDDYKGYDLKGKVALLYVNEPISDDPSFFKGKALTYNGRWTYKYEETARRGALATLIIHRTDLASYGWEVVRNSWGGERSYLKLDGTPKLEAASWIQEEVARKLVGMAGLDLDKLFQQAQSREFKPIELPVHLKAHVVSALRPFSSRNVLGMVAGADYDKGGEAVLYTAHYDHFGIDRSKPGDNIYHGAVDNGTGCGILLEIARAWGATKPAPTRAILFASVTAEEQGLLGSEYLGKHSLELPVDPILDLNYDALAPIGIPEEVEVSGAERTTFYPTVEEIARELGLAIRPDAHPEAGHYYRSDHFSLSRVGIPSFSISEGRKFKGHDLAWGEAKAKDYVDNRYHKTADVFREDWSFAGLAKMASFGYALGQAAAAEGDFDVRWLPGDEFEKAWQKYQSGAIETDALFADHPELKIVHFEPILYPPLARQTSIGGTVVARAAVGQDGTMKQVDVLKGHPLLGQSVKDGLRGWKFEVQPGPERSFDLTCDFSIPAGWICGHPNASAVLGPFHLAVLGGPNCMQTSTASASK